VSPFTKLQEFRFTCLRFRFPIKSDKVRQTQWSLACRPHRITLDPDILTGKPIVRGTRLSVEFIIGLMADGWTHAEILGNYPGLTVEDIQACLAYARDALSSERVYPTAAE
jgi:uncharacterized protein (DUF433 family)